MKNSIVTILLIVFLAVNGYSQTTNEPRVRSSNNNCKIESVSISSTYTIVKIRVPKSYKNVSISNVTVMVPEGSWAIENARHSNIDLSDFPGFGSDAYMNQLLACKVQELRDAKQDLSDKGWLIRSLGDCELDREYRAAKGCDSFVFTLYFDALPPGIERVFIRELKRGGWEWTGIQINNPRPMSLVTSYNCDSIRNVIDEQEDGIVGIYEGTKISDNRYTLGCIKDGSNYKLIYLACDNSLPLWKVGEVKCVLYPSAANGLYKGDWYNADKSKETNCYVSFSGAIMSILLNGGDEKYVKMYPTIGSVQVRNPSLKSGTGFALKDGYIVTNNHVIEGAAKISVEVSGRKVQAVLVATDKINDLAIIKLENNKVDPPYSIRHAPCKVGENCYAMGYPMTQILGNEIKLTNGIISSRTGYEGNINMYQVTAPLQPGNSGCPLFDEKGNVIGIVNSGIPSAENVGYAIKSSCLFNLLESFSLESIVPNAESTGLVDNFEMIKQYVYLIECSNY